MVELKLDALDYAAEAESTKDTFVAVRVGEVQKLSRLTAEKRFKFQQAVVGERKFGRVDVFRRIGSVSIGIKNSSDIETSSNVSVPITDAPPMNFRVQLGAQPEVQKKRQAEAEKLKSNEKDVKVQQAKHYLLEHNLEERLSEAMQAVLRERPADPSAFIGEMLRKSAGDYKQLQNSTPAANLSIGPPPTAEGSKSSTTWDRTPSVGTWLSPIYVRQKRTQSGPAQALRVQAKQALLDAASSGNLERTLQETLGEPSAAPNAASQVDALRLEAKDTILKANKDGVLESTLQEAVTLAAADTSKVGALDSAKRPLAIIPTSVIYGGMMASTGLRPNFMCC